MGFDPGTIKTGYAAVSWEGTDIKLIDFGVLCPPAKKTLEQRLCVIGEHLERLIKKHKPKDSAIEQMFFGKNADSAFKLGQAFGLCVYQSVRHGARVFPYAARFIKQAVTGSGRADKHSVQAFVCNIFKISPHHQNTDATDALACVLCHIYQKQKPDIRDVGHSDAKLYAKPFENKNFPSPG